MTLLSNPTPQEQTAHALRNIVVGGLNFLRATYDNGQQMVWQNPYGLTPQEVFDCLGADSGELVRISDALGDFINTFAPEDQQVGSKKPSVVVLTINADGTVVLS